jgi:hypothetical protein
MVMWFRKFAETIQAWVQRDCPHPTWHSYSSTRERQCTVCKEVQKWDGDAWQITHRRCSGVGTGSG